MNNNLLINDIIEMLDTINMKFNYYYTFKNLKKNKLNS